MTDLGAIVRHAMFARSTPSTTGAPVRRAASSRSRARAASFRARVAHSVVVVASSSSSPTENDREENEGPSASPPTQKIGRFVKREGAAPSPAPLGSGPGDVGSAGVAPPAMNVRVIPLDKADVQGVARATREETDAEKTFRVAQLVAGDALAILAFAAIGRGNHGEGVALADVASTALPFALGWFGAATTVGNAYGEDARGNDGLQSAFIAGKTWAVGGPAGLVMRSIGKGAAPPLAFVVVSMTFAGAFLVGWRYWFASSKDGDVSGNKRGNPLEFMNLLFGLVKRW